MGRLPGIKFHNEKDLIRRGVLFQGAPREEGPTKSRGAGKGVTPGLPKQKIPTGNTNSSF